MAFTPILWKSQTQVNASDSGVQNDGQIAATHDGGYVVVWQSINFIIGQRYDSAGNKLNSEVIAGFNFGEQTTPAVTVLANGNIAVAFADVPAADVYVQIFAPHGAPRSDWTRSVAVRTRVSHPSPPSPTVATSSPIPRPPAAPKPASWRGS
jgi:hypothetical protein